MLTNFYLAYSKVLGNRVGKDVSGKVFIQYYNDYYTWPLAEFKSFCAIQPNDCPIVMHKNYTLETPLLLSSNKDQLHNSGRQNVSKISNE
jgi:hypothetical protein